MLTQWRGRIHPNIIHLLFTSFKLWSEFHGRAFLHLFNLLNPAVPPLIHSTAGCGVLCRNSTNFSAFQNSVGHLLSFIEHCPSTVRASTQGASEPIWCAESNGNLHLSIAFMVPVPQAKTFPISEGENFHPTFFTTCSRAHNYSQNSVEWYF